MLRPRAVVVGAGIFGLATALELHARRFRVAVVDPGPIPHPLAASTDISKVIRMEYGADEFYMEMMEAALAGWEAWNRALGATLFHRTGVTMFTRTPMAPGGFEYESYRQLRARGHAPERLGVDEISRRFPAWKAGAFVDGFVHAVGGFAESGRVIEALAAQARRAGIAFHLGAPVTTLEGPDQGRVTGVRTANGEVHLADWTVVAAGSWTPKLLPELASVMKATGHPVFHLAPRDPGPFTPPGFATFTADVARSGWYGFPVHPRTGVVKIANHGVGQLLDPAHDPRVVTANDEAGLRAFLADTFPALADAPVVFTRRCLYADTLDEHFWIDRHPDREGLVVATGGSGHGFKFGPILGGLVADALEGKENAWLSRFRWRELDASVGGQEAARFHG